MIWGSHRSVSRLPTIRRRRTNRPTIILKPDVDPGPDTPSIVLKGNPVRGNQDDSLRRIGLSSRCGALWDTLVGRWAYEFSFSRGAISIHHACYLRNPNKVFCSLLLQKNRTFEFRDGRQTSKPPFMNTWKVFKAKVRHVALLQTARTIWL